MSGLILVQTVCHSDGIPERYIFENVNFEEENQKSMQNYPAYKELVKLNIQSDETLV